MAPTDNARRALRESLDLSRPQLCAFLGVSEASIVRWEQQPDDTDLSPLLVMLLEALQEAAERDRDRTRKFVVHAAVNLQAAILGVMVVAQPTRAKLVLQQLQRARTDEP